ncbi:MAG: hypothetical protein AAFW70_27300 [Cyanobacteria bacterium J06635_10]
MRKSKVVQIGNFQDIEPRQFLSYCFNLDKLSIEEVIEEEINFGYRSQCIGLLSKILGIKRHTIRKWGDNPNFTGMPQYARQTCSYVVMALSKEELIAITHCNSYKAPLIKAKHFIEEILLKGLSPSEKLKVVSSARFRGQCLKLLGEVTSASRNALYEWGSDIEFKKMPSHYNHTLAYALMAYDKQIASKRSAA